MQFTLINGSYNNEDANEILSRMIKVKIDFHKRKILSETDEEDKDLRLKRIKELQLDLMRIKKAIESSEKPVAISAIVKI